MVQTRIAAAVRVLRWAFVHARRARRRVGAGCTSPDLGPAARGNRRGQNGCVHEKASPAAVDGAASCWRLRVGHWILAQMVAVRPR